MVTNLQAKLPLLPFNWSNGPVSWILPAPTHILCAHNIYVAHSEAALIKMLHESHWEGGGAPPYPCPPLTLVHTEAICVKKKKKSPASGLLFIQMTIWWGWMGGWGSRRHREELSLNASSFAFKALLLSARPGQARPGRTYLTEGTVCEQKQWA